MSSPVTATPVTTGPLTAESPASTRTGAQPTTSPSGQIYLLENPLLRGPLRSEHVKPRLLGHFGTTPGLNLLYVHPEPRDQGA